MQTVSTELDLTYRRRFSDLKIPEAYESLILDALKGDHSNFVRDDELDASWRIFTPFLHYLDNNTEITPMEYPYGESMAFPYAPSSCLAIRAALADFPKAPAVLRSWMISHLPTATNSATQPAINGEARQNWALTSYEQLYNAHNQRLFTLHNDNGFRVVDIQRNLSRQRLRNGSVQSKLV